LVFVSNGTKLLTVMGSAGRIRIWGVSNAEVHQALLESHAIEERLDGRVSAWLQEGPDAAIAKLSEANATLTPDEYRVAGNMIRSRSASTPPKARQK